MSCSRDRAPMAIPDDMVAALRTYLGALHAGSDDAFDDSDRRFLALRTSGEYQGLDVLLLAAFTVAARRRFAPVWYPAEIIRYVAEIRGTTSEMADTLNAAAAENQLRAALGQQVPPFADPETRTRAQMMLLIALTADYTESELDTLMDDARNVADNWLTFAPDK